MKKKITEDELEKAKIPKRFWQLDKTDYFGDAEAMKAVSKYVKASAAAFANGVGLLCRGDRDSGKTFLLSLVLRTLMQQGYTVLYTTLDEISDWMARPSLDEKFNVKLLEPHFIALDDVDSTEGVPRAALRKFVRLRRDNGFPMLIGTSLVRTAEGDDLFLNAYKESAPRILEIVQDIHCSVEPFRIRKHYAELKKLK